jgi:hypothetical protein
MLLVIIVGAAASLGMFGAVASILHDVRALERARSDSGYATLYACGASLALIVGALLVFGAVSPTFEAPASGPSYRAPVCPAEDSCRVDYRRNGWHIQECAGACDDGPAGRGPWQRVWIRH